MKRIFCAILGALIISTLTACSIGNQSSESSDTSSGTQTESSVDTSNVKDGSYDLSFTDRDSDSSFDEASAVKVNFSSSAAESESGSVEISGSQVTIKNEGVYILSGTCSNGKVIVDADSADKIQLVLSNLNLTSSGSAVVIKSADKVFITLADGTDNTIADGKTYTETIDNTNVDAAIFSKDDLSINGSGKLTVNGSYKHGIVSKDDLVIAGGTLSVTSASTAIEGKDSVKIKEAEVTVNAGSDGIRSTNVEETDTRGFVYIAGGTLNITAVNDAVQAASLLRVDGGTFAITTGGGSSSGKVHTENDFRMDMFSSSSDSSDTDSAKGLKSADTVKINGGTFNVNSSDDSIHTNNAVEINGGNLELASGDDGIHADSALTVNGGDINITESYEGLEAGEITINDGTINIQAGDDGFNAAGGDNSDSRDMFNGDASKKLTINGGYIYVNADGDGLDSNGALEVTGGTILVSGPANGGNGALDYGTDATITGGVLVAIGSTGMAETITGSGQCTLQTDIDSQNGGTTCAIVDGSGNVIASLTPEKQYSNVVVSTSNLKTGETYSIVCGGTVEGADSHGYASSGKVSGGNTVTEVSLDTENFSNGGNTMGGGMGGMGGQPGGDMSGFGGNQPGGNMGNGFGGGPGGR